MKDFKDFIQERWYQSFDVGGTTEVFINPSSREMRDIPSMPEVARGLLNARADVFLWDVEILHDEIKDKIEGSIWVAHLEIDFKHNIVHVWPTVTAELAKKKASRSDWIQKYLKGFRVIGPQII